VSDERSGAVLFEMVLALALFVAGAAMLSQVQTSVAQSLERARLSTQATDLATKALAELEAGIITLADLRTMRLRTERSTGRMERRVDVEDIDQPSPWTLSVRTERSPYSGLTLVEVTVAYVEGNPAQVAARNVELGEAADGSQVRITIRQLMRLRDELEGEASATGAEAQS
jgi:hypothetical protein